MTQSKEKRKQDTVTPTPSKTTVNSGFLNTVLVIPCRRPRGHVRLSQNSCKIVFDWDTCILSSFLKSSPSEKRECYKSKLGVKIVKNVNEG